MRKGIVIVLLFAAAAWADSATQPNAADNGGGDQQPQTVLRTYDIRDYLKGFLNHPLAPPALPPTSQPAPQTNPAGAGVAQSVFGGPTAEPGSEQEKIDDLSKLIESTVDPDTWRDNGGSTGSFTAFDGRLYITETPEAQMQVAKVIDEITAGVDRTVHVRAMWLALTEGDLAALRDPAANTDETTVRLNAQALRKATPVARADLLCLDGQTVHITTGFGQGHIRLQIQPRISSAKGQVIVDVLNNVADSNEFHTTARIPLGQEVVIGGITAVAGGKDQPKQLYLVMRVDAQ